MRCRQIAGLVLTAIICFFQASCTDSSEIEQIRLQLQEHEREIQEHEREIQELKLAVQRLNQDISSIRSILGELNSGAYVTSVSEVIQDEKITGYTLSFSDSRGVYLRTLDESDNPEPTIGIRKNEDGLYCWTVNGDLLLDASGKPLPVSGDHAAPQLKAEEGAWSVSTDEGSTWQAVTTNSQSSSPFRNIDTSHPDYVLITLSDGTVLQLPTWAAFVALQNLVNRLNTNLASLQTIVSAIQDGDYLKEVSPYLENGRQVGWLLNFSKSGLVIVYFGTDGADGATPLFKIEDGWWFVSYDDGDTWAKMNRATSAGDGIYIEGVSFPDESSVSIVLSDGTTLSVPRYKPSTLEIESPEGGFPIQEGETRSIPFTIRGTDNGKALVSAVSDGFFRPRVQMDSAMEGNILVTAPSPYTDGFIIVMFDDGNGYTSTTTLKFCRRELKLTQGAEFRTDENGGTITIPWRANYSFSVSSDSSWIHILGTEGSTSGEIAVAVDANTGDSPRSGTLRLHPDDNPGFTSQKIYIEEASARVDVSGPSSMVLDVRASYANDFTVYLPLKGNLDCTVDWGDGHTDTYNKHVSSEDWVSHSYETAEPSSYTVSISGKVERLNALDIPQKAGITAVLNWGNLETKAVDHGFSQLSGLTKVTADTDGFFSQVLSCDYMFSGCTSLSELPAKLFAGGAQISSFNGTFTGCTGLRDLPESLFEGCEAAVDFNETFLDCKELTTLPEDLFSHCPGARNFARAFYCCNIPTVPAQLFAACRSASNFEETFRGSNIELIPAALFDGNRNATIFRLAFWGCSHLDCESPYTLINGRKVHLYERKDYPDYFAAPINYEECFYEGNLYDFDAIRAAGWAVY